MTVDMSTRYLGLPLAHPVMPSASPATGNIDRIHLLIEAGAPALVLPSLFEEQIDHDAMAVHFSLERGADGFGEAPSGFFPELNDYNTGPEDYLNLIGRAKSEIDVPVIASLNGVSTGGWTQYAQVLADQGIDALELNVYLLPSDIAQTSADVEGSYIRLVEKIKAAVDIPLAVKIAPYFSSIPDMARRLSDAGADGLVMFNRFYQPDIELDTLGVEPDLVLSDPVELRLVLRWMAILHGRVDCDLAATSGVHAAEDAIKALLTGATVSMMASALLRHGATRLTEVRDGMEAWLVDHGYESVDQARGSLSYSAVPNPEVFERTGYMKTLTSYVPTW
jgi:dihydroorotate dehydrogenase (fumarate)